MSLSLASSYVIAAVIAAAVGALCTMRHVRCITASACNDYAPSSKLIGGVTNGVDRFTDMVTVICAGQMQLWVVGV